MADWLSRARALAAAFLLALAGQGAPAQDREAPAPAGAEAEEDALVAEMARPWTGDLDGIITRGYLRVGVAYEPIFFSYDRASQQGLTVDTAQELEKHLHATLGEGAGTLTIALMPLPRDVMLDALIDGRVDLVIANLTVTPARAARVDFGDPVLTGVSEVVVTGPAAPEIATLDDLAQTALHLRPSSSYFEHLHALNAARAAAGQAPIPVVAADENLEDYDLLELVDVGVIPAVVVDGHKAALYAQIFERLQVHDGLTVSEDGEIAWAMRKDSPQLMAAVNGFVETARKGTALGNILYKRWVSDADRVLNAIAPGEDAKFDETIGFIRTHAEAYDFDPILIAAQGYQESRLDQSKRSPVGAIGIMQVMPDTANDPNVAIPDIELAERNVEAGVKYLRFLRDHYFSDPGMTRFDRALFSFAAYNAGPGNIAKARKHATAMGLDPNVWFGNVEVAAGRTISREPVVYVRNVLKYYVSYEILSRRRS